MFPIQSTHAPADFNALDFPLAGEPYYSGIRCIVQNDDKRQFNIHGIEFNLATICKDIAKEIKGWDMGVYDGMLVCDAGKAILLDTIAARCRADEAKHPFADNVVIKFIVFDRLSEAEWHNSSSTQGYKVRCIDSGICNPVIINNIQQAQSYYDKVVADGFKGIILKNLQGKYNNNKNNMHFKVIAPKIMQLTLTGYTIGQGKVNNEVMGLHAENKRDTHPTIRAFILKGLTEEIRNELTKEQEAYMYADVTVTYVDLIQRTNETLLYFPTLVSINKKVA